MSPPCNQKQWINDTKWNSKTGQPITFYTVYFVTFNSFPIKPWFVTSLQCKSFENAVGKGKLLVTSNFSSSHSVFYRLGDILFSPVCPYAHVAICLSIIKRVQSVTPKPFEVF